jgi:CheY-like chemotaxis protein
MTRLVVADDDPIQLKLAVRRLELAGYSVRSATDGDQALELVRADPPDVVVSDVVMPNRDGFALCEAMRTDPALAGVPVLLITNSSLDASDRMLAKRAGARALVVRTPDFGDVIAAIEQLTTTA